LIVIIRPAKRIKGRLVMPGDKSISHRAAMLSALATGVSRIRNYANSGDCGATLSCLRQLGVQIESTDDELTINGCGLGGFRGPAAELDCANSGTTMRLLAGILAAQNFISTLTGDASLSSRPMERIVEPLGMMGAIISSHDGHAPLEVRGATLQGIDYELLVPSAQVKSSILLAGLHAHGKTKVIEDQPTRDHTERLLNHFGVAVELGVEGATKRSITVTGPAQLHACEFSIPGDISSAAYFIAAAALLPGSSLQIDDVGLNPTRSLFVKELQQLGLNVETFDVHEAANEPVGNISVRASDSRIEGNSPWTIRGLAIPQLIDELPLLAIIGSQLGGIEVHEANELRLKESDRIAATVSNLRAMGAQVEEFDDGFRVFGPVKLRGTKIDPRGDHRIAMAFTVAGLLADGETEISDSECVAVSFPEFFELLESVAQNRPI
jgi:3-phosphoshikimate 1-carboxyvinyltransferase